MDSADLKIETPRSRADEESLPCRQAGDSVKDLFSVLFANPAAVPTGNALTGIQPLETPDLKEVRSLLSLNQLPFEDIENSSIQFFGIKFKNKIIASGALEVYNKEAILRSLVVHNEFRNLGLGKKMLCYLENAALKLGISSLFLLTTTAHNYFLKEGYNLFERKDCPAEIYSSSEFKDLCPSTAICMKKDLY